MRATILFTAGIAAGLLGLSCKATWYSPYDSHCANQNGNDWCAMAYPDGSRPFCSVGLEGCEVEMERVSDDRDGCVPTRPAEDACYSPCGDGVTVLDDGSCLDSGSSSSGSGSSSGTTTDESSDSGSDSSTTGPMPCVSDDECTNAEAPFCGTTGDCGTCDATDDPEGACAGVDAMAPLCVGDACVACTAENHVVCDEQLLLCDDASNSCVPCDEHDQCESGACQLAVGTCFPPDAVVHVDGDGRQDFTTVVAAVNAVAASGVGVVVVHEQDSGLGYPGVLIDGSKTIALLAAPGESPILQGTGGNPGLRVEGAGTILYLDGLGVVGNTMGLGLRVDGALAWVDRSRIVQNSGGGIVAQNGAELTLRNCFVGGNGVGGPGSFGIDVSNANVRVLYTTVARNDEAAIDSIRCSSATVDVRNSIVVGRDPNSIDCPGIVVTDSALDEDIGTNLNVGAAVLAWFADGTAGDFHLTPMGATTFENIAQWMSGDPPIDIDGDLRPAIDGTADYAGADVP